MPIGNKTLPRCKAELNMEYSYVLESAKANLNFYSNDYASTSFKLNFTFLRFPLSKRSISLQNDIGSWISHTAGCTIAK